MSEPCQNNLNGEEDVPLNHVPGTGVEQPEDTCSQVICISDDPTASCCSDKYHRKLAIASIVCGFSCCGVPALVYSVKAEDADKAEKEMQMTHIRRAKKWGIISITTWVCLLVSAPVLLVLVSYLITLSD